jgi:hypothetical protein
MPSVTQVLRFVHQEFSGISQDILDMACERGNEVHRATVCHAKGLFVVGEIFPKFQGYLHSFTAWFDQYVEEVILAEERLHHPVFDYDGEPDLVLLIKGDSLPSLWDIKSPRRPAKSWRPQVAAYKQLVEVNGIEIGRCGCLRLSPEGRPPILDESTASAHFDFTIFMSALNCWRYFNE